MPSQVLKYATRELSTRTWPDFESLFSRGGGWDFCWCMHFHRTRMIRNKRFRTRVQQGVRNRREKKELVASGRTHGILVYAKREPVGWCQYGPKEELPRIDGRRDYGGLAPKGGAKRLWRITCFVVDKRYRRLGVARIALKAALEAIRKKGGGVVEAYPLTHWSFGAFGNVSVHGAASMFEKEGFKTVAPFGRTRYSTNVLMRRTV